MYHYGVVHHLKSLKDTLPAWEYALLIAIGRSEEKYLRVEDAINLQERMAIHAMFASDDYKKAFLYFGHWQYKGYDWSVQASRRETSRLMASSTAFSDAAARRLDNLKQFQLEVKRHIQQSGYDGNFDDLAWISGLAKKSFHASTAPSPAIPLYVSMMHGQKIDVKVLLAAAGAIEYTATNGSKPGTHIEEARYPLQFELGYQRWQDCPYASWFCQLLGFEVFVLLLLGC